MSALKKPHIIVFGNEKGGTGKSTIAMHVISHLLRMGFKVGSMDVDARQGTLTRYIENRRAFFERTQIPLPMPTHYAIHKAPADEKNAEIEEHDRFKTAVENLMLQDFIVIDTPGSDSNLSRIAHSFANTLITPLNDSFIDLDMLARINPETKEIERPSTYAEMVWEQKKQRALRREDTFDWIVVRNRLAHLYMKNTEEMLNFLDKLAKRIGFRLAKGFGERVIFRELFLNGLTLLDLKDAGVDMTLSHVSARQELRDLISLIRLPEIEEKLKLAS